MAYNVIPKTFEEAGKAVKHMDTVRAAEALRLFNVLTEKYGNILPDPIAFDPGNKSVCKISRQLVGSFTIRDIKSQLKIKNLQPDFGNGSRGNRGAANQGTLFEREMENLLNDWIENPDDLKSNKYRNFIFGLVDHYGLEKCTALRVVPEGAENKKRPMKIVNGHWQIGGASPTKGYNIGATVTDVTLVTQCKGEQERNTYLSLKTSGTTNLSNLGLKTNVFPVDQVKAGSITTEAGLALIDTFGLKQDLLCETFNAFQSGSRDFHEIDNSPSYDRNLLKELIKGSLGWGYHYVHLHGGHIHHLEIDERFLNAASVASGVKVAYGGNTGGAKRVNINLKTPLLDMAFNIRNTSDKGSKADPDRVYPDKLQSGYKMKGESIMTKFPGDAEEDAHDNV